MPTNYRVLLVAMAAVTVAAGPALASVPTDTVRAEQCSPSAMIEPDTNAKWFRVTGEWHRETPDAWSNDSLRTELLALENKDQAVRQAITPDSIKNSAFMDRMRQRSPAYPLWH